MFKLQKNDKNNVRITAKLHEHLHTLTKTPAKFQKDLNKIVGEVVFTRYLVSACFGRSKAKKSKKVTMKNVFVNKHCLLDIPRTVWVSEKLSFGM